MSLKNNRYLELFEQELECCGCSACEAICPADAIEMVLNRDGFYYPQINPDKCICCLLCETVCKDRLGK